MPKPDMHKAAFVGDHLEPTTDFDFDEIDKRLEAGDDVEDELKQVEIVSAAKLLHHIVTVGATDPREMMCWVNVFLFVMGIHPNQEHSGERIGRSLCMSKEEFFRRASKMRRILRARGLFLPKISGEWSNEGRRSIANSAMQRWRKRGGKPMLRISEAEKKLNWIADYSASINFDQLTPLARKELKAKLKPIVTISERL